MTIEEILKQEEANRSTIHLHLEGTFWRAYEKSAYLACIVWKEHKKLRRYIKYVKRDIVVIGFPSSVLEERLDGFQYDKIDEKTIRVKTKVMIGEGDFQKWRAVESTKTQVENYVHAYDTIPVYKTASDLIMSFMNLSRHMRSDLRESYGYVLHISSLNMMRAISAANRKNADKVACLEEALEAFADVDLICKLLYEAREWSPKQYSHLMIELGSVAGQLTAWKNSYKKKDETASDKNEADLRHSEAEPAGPLRHSEGSVTTEESGQTPHPEESNKKEL